VIYDPDVETRAPQEQHRIDREQYAKQIDYLFAHSTFYRERLTAAGFSSPAAIGSLDDLEQLPFTEKDDLRRTQADLPPFGAHLACDAKNLVRVYSTSGTTGVPCYIGLTPRDLDMYATNVARGYTAAGFRKHQRIAVGFNAGPFVAGAVYYGFDKIGCNVIPVGTGNTERLVGAIRNLGATGISCTPSYGLYMIDWCRERGIETRSLGLRNMITAAEPGGGDPMIRERIETAFNCVVRESMGIGDVSLSVWAEDDDGKGMNLAARGFVHVELIDPATGKRVPWEHEAQGELVYTALQRESMPLLRFRSRDHVVVNMQPNPTGRTGPRIRCIGRTDDMLIVRGVNLYPTAIRGILRDFTPDVGEIFRIRPRVRGVSQPIPLPIVVELGPGVAAEPPGLRERLTAQIKNRLLVSADVQLVPHGTLPRDTYKTKLVEYPEGVTAQTRSA
jgi:phenylacetate-CoA ligase